MHAETTPLQALWQGARDSAPFTIVVVPFAVLFGVVGTEAGLNLAQVMGFSFLVIAGASQFAALQLMTDNAPVLIVVASALAVNLRMAMYSAALAPHLGAAPVWQRALIAYMNVDQTYALAAQRYERAPPLTVPAKVAFFFGTCIPIVPLWYAGTLSGALLGSTIPSEWGLDFAVPITFLALTAPALRTGAHVTAAVTSVTVMLLLAGLPWNLGLLVAGLAGMAAGAEVERRMTRRAREATT
ncbi:AzlC family ABC transporter permease [Roseibacterium sp. SDUM158017]|uniref:AzlC family ABC transporter permease n=1 Tax=Roseicyclus salinarum TaxID=3036773 RepID=UPI002415545E|nr:AzlC family ABC transporter permease [Roseibacterium sp. SDUM158017]MDG4648985.1 AzlC family ABC transporter permease [Roseibacterium sp. SDUM158017]